MKFSTAPIFKTLRKISEPHLSAEKLAEKLGLSTSCVSAAERGTSAVSKKTINKYCVFYNIPDEQFSQLFSEALTGEKSDEEIANETEKLYNLYN